MDNEIVEKAYDKVVDMFGEDKTNKALVLSVLAFTVTFAGYLFFGPEEAIKLIENNDNKEEN